MNEYLMLSIFCMFGSVLIFDVWIYEVLMYFKFRYKIYNNSIVILFVKVK